MMTWIVWELGIITAKLQSPNHPQQSFSQPWLSFLDKLETITDGRKESALFQY